MEGPDQEGHGKNTEEEVQDRTVWRGKKSSRLQMALAVNSLSYYDSIYLLLSILPSSLSYQIPPPSPLITESTPSPSLHLLPLFYYSPLPFSSH
ncbi:hypothetical protein M8J77_018538 [Diaphorina citri]|nr:hypothetical protein M8J77_018538 [Diaphorina citri]